VIAGSFPVLRDLLFHHKSRFQGFLFRPEAIASNILSDRLAQPEERGITSRSRGPENRLSRT